MPHEKYIEAILYFYHQNKRMPSYGEIMKLTGYKSRNSVYKIIPGAQINAIRVLGTVEAGWPSPAEEELVDTMTLDEYLIGNKEATFMLKVEGDSMIDAGIMPGDMALVARGPVPRDGDIVIAQVDGEWTMKYFKKKGKKVFLRPANKKYKDIIPDEELNIAAIVKAIVRKY
jgi:SOS regulatory protein LexA